MILKLRFFTTECGLAVIPFMSGTWSRCGWIVWVCINQSDDDEKAIQVQMMGKIYSMASTVIVWLGPRSIGSDMAMGHLEWLYHRINMIEEKVIEQTRDLDELTYPTQDLEAVGIQEDDYLWERIEQLLDRSWFKRLWTVQEVCLARYCVIACRSRLIRWDKLVALIQKIRQHRLLQMIQPDFQSFNSGTPFAVEYLDRMKTQIRRIK
jgi:Heterokaryon incompatibility protein (HET)